MGIHERDPCRLTWAISGDFRLVVLGILLYSCVLRTKTRSKIAPWQVQRSFARRICAKAMKSPQTIRRLLARALKMHRCKSVGQNRHVSLPCMPRKRSDYPLSLRQNKNLSFPGHAPGKDTLRAANAATKVGFTGRKQNKRSEFCCLPVISCRYSSAISPVPTAYRSHRVFFLMKNPLCSCMYTPPQSKAVHP